MMERNPEDRESPMPFGNESTRDLGAADVYWLYRLAVTNAFRQ